MPIAKEMGGLKSQGDEARWLPLATGLNIPPVLATARAAWHRTGEEPKGFFNPRLEDLHDSFPDEDMHKVWWWSAYARLSWRGEIYGLRRLRCRRDAGGGALFTVFSASKP